MQRDASGTWEATTAGSAWWSERVRVAGQSSAHSPMLQAQPVRSEESRIRLLIYVAFILVGVIAGNVVIAECMRTNFTADFEAPPVRASVEQPPLAYPAPVLKSMKAIVVGERTLF